MTVSPRTELDRQGFVMVPAVLTRHELDALGQVIEPLLRDCPAAGIRGIAERLPAVRALARCATVAKTVGERLCAAQAGDALLLRPLLLHASRKASSARPRRIIHLEYCAVELPAPLAWNPLA